MKLDFDYETNAMSQMGRMVKVRDVIEVKYGKGLPEENRVEGRFQVFGSGGVVGSHEEPLTAGPTVVIGRKGSIGTVYYSKSPCWPIDTTYYVDAFNDLIPEFFVHALRSLKLDKRDTSTAIPGLNRDELYELEFFLPPVEEQARIVAQLEVLLGRIRRTQERLEGVPTHAQRLREAVLAAACSGRLTEDWRAAHPPEEPPAAFVKRLSEECQRRWAEDLRRKGRDPERAKYPVPLDPNPDFAEALEEDLPDGWALVSMDAITSLVTSGPRGWSKYYRDEASSTFIMAQNVRPLRFDRSTRQPVDPPAEDSSRDRCAAYQHDLLVTIVGANTGDVCRIPEPVEEHFVCQSVALMRPVLPEMSQYLELYLNSSQHGQGQYRAWMYGEGRPHLNFEQLKSTVVALPPLEEQREIVRRAERLLILAGTVENRARTARAGTERLAQGVLNRAFSGRLASVLPDHEPST